jgi:L-xylulokinase
MTKYLLGIDNGSTVTKAALYDTSGRELAVSAVKTEMVFPLPGHAEKDVEALWAANRKVIGDVLRKAGVTGAEVAGVAVTGYGNGMYLIAEDGSPAHAGINSADSRATDYVERWYRDGTFERVLPRVCQPVWAGQPAALLAWFRDNRPEELARTRWVFPCKDYIRWRLTGEAFGEVTDLSGTSLLNVRELRYDPEILAAYGLQGVAEKLPPLRGPADLCGRITAGAAAETGLVEGTPVAGGMFDIVACAAATGITSTDRILMIAGSWSINEYISTAPVEHHDYFMSVAYGIPGYWLIAENSPTSASNLEWFVSELMGGEAAEARAGGHSVFERCSELVASVPPEKSDVLFLPFLYGSNAGPRASAAFLGLHGWHTKAHMLRAVYEGVAFSHRTHVERFLKVRPPAKAARIAGGAAKSGVWLQIFADALQLPIEVTACEELGAMGAAMCAGVAVGAFSSFEEAAARMVRVSRTVEPDRGKKALYDGKYAAYGRTVQALRAVWER